MTSNMDRIAKLEDVVNRIGTDLTAALARLDALEGKPPERDPASTTGAHVERAPQFDYDRRRPASFGFAAPGAYVGGASVAEDVRDERWRDAQS